MFISYITMIMAIPLHGPLYPLSIFIQRKPSFNLPWGISGFIIVVSHL
jgi:hypothetical protein